MPIVPIRNRVVPIRLEVFVVRFAIALPVMVGERKKIDNNKNNRIEVIMGPPALLLLALNSLKSFRFAAYPLFLPGTFFHSPCAMTLNSNGIDPKYAPVLNGISFIALKAFTTLGPFFQSISSNLLLDLS